jgi:ionotropic glutamate receptor
MQLFKQEVVAVIGPQSTTVAGFVAHMATVAQVPLLSFAVTDPSFSEHQYPYFFRIAHSDAMQMQAIASLIARYGWRDVVIVYVDDDYGNSAVSAFRNAIRLLGFYLVEKMAILPDSDNSTISSILTDLSSRQPRVFVVHLPQNLSLLFFAQAKNQQMMTPGYVWIASDFMISTLTSTAVDSNVFNNLQGLIGIRGYAQKSSELKAFVSKWNNQSALKQKEDDMLIYGLYAYDATRMLAYAIDNYVKTGFNITFRNSTFSSLSAGASSDLTQIKIFEGGSSLSSSILQTRFPGTSGYVQLSPNGDLNRTAFQILNIVGEEFKVVGYWTNETQLSVSPPTNVSDPNFARSQASALPIRWPGDLKGTPRGWTIPRPLKIAVPRITGFDEFLKFSIDNKTNVTTYSGYCIDLFQKTLNYLPYPVPFSFELFGNESGPVYEDMILALAQEV